MDRRRDAANRASHDPTVKPPNYSASRAPPNCGRRGYSLGTRQNTPGYEHVEKRSSKSRVHENRQRERGKPQCERSRSERERYTEFQDERGRRRGSICIHTHHHHYWLFPSESRGATKSLRRAGSEKARETNQILPREQVELFIEDRGHANRYTERYRSGSISELPTGHQAAYFENHAGRKSAATSPEKGRSRQRGHRAEAMQSQSKSDRISPGAKGDAEGGIHRRAKEKEGNSCAECPDKNEVESLRWMQRMSTSWFML